MNEHEQIEDENTEYAAFVEKFKPKKTTDDCYTPPNIYNAVADWAAKKYGFDKSQIVRPFWPGYDYERFTYEKDCVVLDNPPFSILSKILNFYNLSGIRYFLFAPGLTQFSGSKNSKTNYVTAHCTITYENGAKVNTSFNTNMGDYLIETAPDLHEIIEKCNTDNSRLNKKKLPIYKFPDCVITTSRLGWLSKHGQYFRVKRKDAIFIRTLDDMPKGSAIFGGAFMLTERAAAERAAAERAAAERAAAEGNTEFTFKLSEREKNMQRSISAQ